jgi:hypothetical protein
MAKYKDLFDFIDRAVKSRKYPDATARTLKASLKLYEAVLNDEELNSLDKFKENFEPITANVFNKNANSFSASSLTTYKSRAQKVLADFEKYGDPTKMNSWSPKTILRTKKSVSPNESSKNNKQIFNSEEGVAPEKTPEDMHKIQLALRPDTKFIVIVPRDIKKNEAATMKAIIDSLVVNE